MAIWNIYKQQSSGWTADLETLNAGADMLLLQEVYLDREIRDWLDQHLAHWDMNPAFIYKNTYAGVMTTGRFPASSQCSLRVYEPLTGIPKTALLSYHRIEGHHQTLLAVNIHGVNFTLDSRHLERQLTAVSEVIRAHQGPVVLAGDFNTWNESRTRLLESITSELKLIPVLFEGQQPSSRFGYRIDHIYYRGLKPLSSQVITVNSSDHYPLTVRFSLGD